MEIELEFDLFIIKGTLLDTPTAEKIWQALPFTARVMTWGDEFYFGVPAQAELESDAKVVVEVGALAYWPTMPAFCVFFGPTPVSHGQEPRAASPVNVFGKLHEVDQVLLRSVQDGEEVRVKQVMT